MKPPAKQRIARNPHGARTAKRRSAPRKPHLHTGAAASPLGKGRARPAGSLHAAAPAPVRRTTSHDAGDARPRGRLAHYMPGHVLCHLLPLAPTRPRPAVLRDSNTGRLLGAAPAPPAYDRLAAERSALFGEAAERLANLRNHGADDE